jgi:hypothetical protein
MRLGPLTFVWMALVAVVVCLIVLRFGGRAKGEPVYAGHRLSYWVSGLQPTGVDREGRMFRYKADATKWYQLANTMREHSSIVISNAGAECLPFLLFRLTQPDRPMANRVHRWLDCLRQGAFLLHLIDSAPGQDQARVRRGQALTAILMLRKQANSLVPQLSEAAASDKNDAITAAASWALWEIDPDEFRRIQSPRAQHTRATQKAGGAANRSQPADPQTNSTSAVAGSSR